MEAKSEFYQFLTETPPLDFPKTPKQKSHLAEIFRQMVRSFGNTLQRIMPEDAPTRHSEFLRYYAESEGSLRTFIRTMLQSREDISEVLQETTLFLWDRFSEFDQSKDFKNWAFGVARMKALALLRDRRRDRHIFDDDLVERLADEAIGMESRHLSHREALSHCLEKLPAHQREMVLAAYTKGTRMDDLAKQRLQTPMSLYKLLQRIRFLLLACVRQQFREVEASS